MTTTILVGSVVILLGASGGVMGVLAAKRSQTQRTYAAQRGIAPRHGPVPDIPRGADFRALARNSRIFRDRMRILCGR
jgi:hypothetical protein